MADDLGLNLVTLSDEAIIEILRALDLPNCDTTDTVIELRDAFRQYYPVDFGASHEIYFED